MASTVGVDVGGTFTDVVHFDGESLSGWKVPTTTDQAQGVAAALGEVDPSRFLHGTTAGTNALLEERGARVALVTSAGFEDVIEIGRQSRPSLYDPFADRPQPLVDRSRRLGLSDDLGEVVAHLAGLGIESVAVALVRSYADPGPERRAAEEVRGRLGLPVSVAADISPEFREYERVATTVLDAYLTPEIAGYLSRLDGMVGSANRLVMTSSGGLLPFGSAVAAAGRLVLSGPAAGVIAASALGQAMGHDSMISFDMGGTSTDVCRIERGRPAAAVRTSGPAGRVNRVPSLPIRTIGAGGGSIAWIDEGGALRVGPRSAGADPGPACYRRGGEGATVTDANLLLGRIPSDLPLGGALSLDVAAAERALGRLGAVLGMEPLPVAGGVVDVVDSHMERALRSVSVEEGVDPRHAVLVAFGGAGGLHVSRLAKRLGMRAALVPPLSGVFSALGLLLARPSSDAAATVLLDEGDAGLGGRLDAMRDRAMAVFARDHLGEPVGADLIAEMRYRGQSHELPVPADHDWASLRRSFENEHRTRFGFERPDQPVEVVNLRATAWGRAPLDWQHLPTVAPGSAPEPRTAPALVAGRMVEVPVLSRPLLPAGFEADGPAVVVEKDAAVWLEEGDRIGVHADGTLEIGW